MSPGYVLAAWVTVAFSGGCGLDGLHIQRGTTVRTLAERYVKIVLALGQHDADYVDAYYGPPEWRKEAEATKQPLAEIDRDARAALATLVAATPASDAEELVRLRHRYVTRQLEALRTRVAMLLRKSYVSMKIRRPCMTRRTGAWGSGVRQGSRRARCEAAGRRSLLDRYTASGAGS